MSFMKYEEMAKESGHTGSFRFSAPYNSALSTLAANKCPLSTKTLLLSLELCVRFTSVRSERPSSTRAASSSMEEADCVSPVGADGDEFACDLLRTDTSLLQLVGDGLFRPRIEIGFLKGGGSITYSPSSCNVHCKWQIKWDGSARRLTGESSVNANGSPASGADRVDVGAGLMGTLHSS